MPTKVTFILPAEVVADANTGIIIGDFNSWNLDSATSLEKQADGTMSAVITLEPGQTYQYRYLLDGYRWVNDHNQNYTYAYGFEVENCIITVAQEQVAVSYTHLTLPTT